MAKPKTVAVSANLGANDIQAASGEVKFICEFPENIFILKALNNKGEVIYKTDANGNNKVPEIQEYKFIKISGQKNKDGKVDPTTAFCFFIASKKIHGSEYQRIVDKLERDCLNKKNKMYKEVDHFKKRNPEAFAIAEDKARLENERDGYKDRVAELEAKLGLAPKGA